MQGEGAKSWFVVFGAVALGLATGCQLALDVNRPQCASDQQCVELFGREYACNADRVCEDATLSMVDAGETDAGPKPRLPPEWQCIEGDPRVVAPIDGRTANVRFLVTSFAELTVPDTLSAKACQATDLRCENPIDTSTPDAEGFLELTVPHGWRGYTELNADDYLQSLVYVNEPFTMDEMPEGPTVSKLETIMQINEGENDDIPFDENDGLIIASVRDCNDEAAAGVRFEIETDDEEDSEEHPFYFEGTLPLRTREVTAISTQLTRGGAPVAVGGFSHVTPGYAIVKAVLAETGDEIGKISVQVRRQTLTYVDIHAGY